LKQNFLSNRVFDTYDTYDAIVDACCLAWNILMDAPDPIRSVAQRERAKTVKSWGGWYQTVRRRPQFRP
jgi:hypothetical protein